MTLSKLNKNNSQPTYGAGAINVKSQHFNPVVDKVNEIDETSSDNAVQISINTADIATNTADISSTNSILDGSGLSFMFQVVLTDNEIVGTSAGQIGHVDGAVLIPAPTSEYFIEFISATLIYEYDTDAYTGGGDDLKFQVGGSGSQVDVSTTITDANLIKATGDKVMTLKAIPTEINPYVGAALSIAGTAYTNPGTAQGVVRINVEYRLVETNL